MIDFRYHMVSLAAVLVALAMGVLLGAGPLRDDIGDTLTGEVTKLRQEKETLRAQSEERDRALEAQDDFVETLMPTVVDGRLDGRGVALVRLPGADNGDVTGIADAVRDAGGRVTATVTVDQDWFAAAGSRTMDLAPGSPQVLADARRAIGRTSGEPTMPEIFGLIIGSRSADNLPLPSTAQRLAAFAVLGDAGLVSGAPPQESPSAVVLVGGVIPQDAGDGQGEEDAATRTATQLVELAADVDRRSGGAVLTAPEPSVGGQAVSPVSVAREDSGLSDGLSTVDGPERAIGRAQVVLALQEQLAGDSGHYGVAADATSAIPDES